MSVIFSASTSLGSPVHTSRFLRPFLLWLDPHLSEKTFETIHYTIRKTAHFVEYSILGALLWRVVHSAAALASHSVARRFRLALLIAALYAATDETHQIFVPTRQAAIHDVMLDTCGAAFGITVMWWFSQKRISQ